MLESAHRRQGSKRFLKLALAAVLAMVFTGVAWTALVILPGHFTWMDIKAELEGEGSSVADDAALVRKYEELLDRDSLKTSDGRSTISYAVWRRCIEVHPNWSEEEACFARYLGVLAEHEDTEEIERIIGMAPRQFVPYQIIWSTLSKHEKSEKVRKLLVKNAGVIAFCYDPLSYTTNPKGCIWATEIPQSIDLLAPPAGEGQLRAARSVAEIDKALKEFIRTDTWESETGRRSMNETVVDACARGQSVGVEECYERYIELVVARAKFETLDWMIMWSPNSIGRPDPFWKVLRNHAQEEKVLRLLRSYARRPFGCLDLLEYSTDPEKCIVNAIERIRNPGGMIEGRWLQEFYRIRKAEAIPVLKTVESLRLRISVRKDGKSVDMDPAVFVRELIGEEVAPVPRP